MPGPTPAMKRSPTEAPVTTAYMIMEMLGGISRAMMAELMMRPELALSG